MTESESFQAKASGIGQRGVVEDAKTAIVDATVVPDSAPVDRSPVLDQVPGAASARAVGCCTLGQLADAFESLAELSNQVLDISCAVKVLRVQRACRPQMIRVLEARTKEASRLGKSLGNGNYQLPDGKLEEYRAALRPLLSEVIPIPSAAKFTLAEFAGVKITPVNLDKMAPLLSDL